MAGQWEPERNKLELHKNSADIRGKTHNPVKSKVSNIHTEGMTDVTVGCSLLL